MKCLSTRATPEGYKRRRYESPSGARHTTIEVPLKVWDRLSKSGSPRNRIAEAERALERESLKRQALALSLYVKSMRLIARRLGLPATTVRRWITERKMK